MLIVENLASGYGKLQVLRQLTFELSEGEIVGIIGPNGAGKSTLLRTISGLIKPWGGTLRLAGEDVTGLRTQAITRRGLSHVPENRLVFPSLSVLDNIRLGGWLRRKQGIEATHKTQQYAFELFPRLEERSSQLAGTLSGGEQQMLAIARGLMARPKLLVLDEPSLGIAPLLVTEIFASLDRLRADGLTILIVEQNVRAAFKISDRALVIDKGEILLSGSPTELRSDPRVRSVYLGGHGDTPSSQVVDLAEPSK